MERPARSFSPGNAHRKQPHYSLVPYFLTLAYFGYYLFALPFSAFFFLTALRQVHNGFHNSLGTNKFLTWLSLFLNSILMVASIHAVKFNHIRHHKYCLTEEDYEGKSARMTWYGAILVRTCPHIPDS